MHELIVIGLVLIAMLGAMLAYQQRGELVRLKADRPRERETREAKRDDRD